MEKHWIWAYIPRVLPPQWRVDSDREDGRKWVAPAIDFGPNGPHPWSVIMSGHRELDGKRWIHLSTAMMHRLPYWHELVMVRDTFLGAGSRAIQVLAPKSDHVNIHPNCLHLWHCVDGDPLPDFTQGTGSI